MEFTEEFHRVFVLAISGFGQSGKLSNHDYSIKVHNDYISAFLDKLNLPQKVTFVGQNWGASFSFHWSNMNRDRVKVWTSNLTKEIFSDPWLGLCIFVCLSMQWDTILLGSTGNLPQTIHWGSMQGPHILPYTVEHHTSSIHWGTMQRPWPHHPKHTVGTTHGPRPNPRPEGLSCCQFCSICEQLECLNSWLTYFRV